MRLLQSICLLFLLKTVATRAEQIKLSSPEECARTCKVGEKPRNCYYEFTIEYYTTMNKACDLCRPNSTNQLMNTPQCQCVEADGFERAILSINRMIPGPSIQVCEKDKIIVDVINKLKGMSASIHWHGLFQKGYQYYDGVPMLTQCPITEGATFRYQFGADNAGTHFYHSHSGLQKLDGQYGALIVRQPQSIDPHGKLYDYDSPDHVLEMNDWMHELSTERFPGHLVRNPGQVPENVLINGKGRWKDPLTNKTTTVQIETFNVKPGKRYRFRIINSFASVCPAQLTIEGHTLLLIAQDGEPVRPVPVNTIVSFTGERVDVVLVANQTIGSYWIQVRALGECVRHKATQVAVLRYTGGPAEPKTPQPTYDVGLKRGILYNPLDGDCDRPRCDAVCVSQLESVKPISSDIFKLKPDYQIKMPFEIYDYGMRRNGQEGVFKPGTYPTFLAAPDRTIDTAVVAGISSVFPDVPPLSQYLNLSKTCNRNRMPEECGDPCECPHTHHIKKGAVVEVVIYDKLPQPSLSHPFHLHGYAFHIMKMGSFRNVTTISDKDINRVLREHEMLLKSGQYKHPPAKDTVAIPESGYVIFRFKADNPGWWLFHCHFLYHIVIGMNVMFHVGEPKDLPPVPPKFPTCGTFKPEIL